MSSNGTRPHRESAGSVGIVQRQYAHFDESLPLRCGKTLAQYTLAYETYGSLNAEKSNVILICHALTGDSHVAGYYTDDIAEQPGWWDEAVGPGKMFDTNRFFIICSNVIGGCQGSTGPSSFSSDGKRFALRFPSITVMDMVRAQWRLLDYLGIPSLFAVAGGSLGGMQALQWAVDFPDMVEHCLFLASTPRSSTQNIAFNEIGRQAIYADPHWNQGDYYDGESPNAGLAVARMVGHITYMSEHSLETKFSRRLQDHSDLPYQFVQPEYQVESYLQYQGRKFIKRFDANSYLYITKACDYFDIGEGHPTLADALCGTKAKFLVVSFSSDWLYTPEQALDLVTALESIEREVRYHLIHADFGHDSFLVEVDLMTNVVGGYLTEMWAKKTDRMSVE